MRGQTNSSIKHILGASDLLDITVISPASRVVSLGEHSATIGSLAEKVVEHYRAQFSAIESMVAQMNQTSGYLNQQLAKIG